ncbi:MAG: hypothetical protein L0J86_05625 [Corynebacterium sp.]|nr:hypothetical protein [Micrococcaceae bacterium]MDN6258867.1 hypothetical protein [Corynebacterium sp.]MDN6387143.1 hypothetical protein [Corynebacterium sp.]MDN6511526.1 hypothetical protein [Corynebacterium sp.]
MFEFLGNLFNQLIEIAQLVISYITQGPRACPRPARRCRRRLSRTLV